MTIPNLEVQTPHKAYTRLAVYSALAPDTARSVQSGVSKHSGRAVHQHAAVPRLTRVTLCFGFSYVPTQPLALRIYGLTLVPFAWVEESGSPAQCMPTNSLTGACVPLRVCDGQAGLIQAAGT